MTKGHDGNSGSGSDYSFNGMVVRYDYLFQNKVAITATVVPEHEVSPIRYGAFGLGASWKLVSDKPYWLNVGLDLKKERIRQISSWSGSASTEILRPWASASFNYFGLLVPFRTKKLAPFTRIEFSYPVYSPSKTGLEGDLIHGMTSLFASVQLGLVI